MPHSQNELIDTAILELSEAADILGERGRNFMLDRTNTTKAKAFADALIELQAAERQLIALMDVRDLLKKL